MRNSVTALLRSSSGYYSNMMHARNFTQFFSSHLRPPARMHLPKMHKYKSTSTSPVLKLGKLNHVAIATPDLDKATSFYRDVLGAQVSKPEDLPSHGVTTVFVNLSNTKIELLHPFGEKSPIQKFLDKNKDGGIHHICIEVDDVFEAVESIKAGGKIRILDPKPKIGAHGKPVVFLHPKDCGGVLIELEQS